ncbi:cobaltochelatase subunit CobN [Xylophilus sp.]|uniref:cobaltochelatase subunit CobN n=1 Tax=Xylophilus sp. TaxID=2653893 RepID=UPI0013B930FC|nr:cobaltochelatase subunit CobN [Xylophilus sp.]KAF1043005.1 MAG: Aerobic cobaltochelatase subunit CobN [Xylophilus sp.]
MLVFGRGLKLSDEQLEALRAAGFAGTPVYVDGATNPQRDVTSLKGADLDAVAGYLRNGGSVNYARMLNYARRVFDGKRLFSVEVEPPQAIAQDVFFHLDENAVFEDFAAFERWLRQRPGWTPGRPRLALLTSVPGPFNANRDHVDAVIRAFEAKGFDVVPIAAIRKRLDFLRKADPAAVVFMPHGRLTLGQADEARQWLAERNSPLFAPVTVFSEQQDWLADQRSYGGGLLTMSVTLPELDGAVAPMAIAAQERDADGFKVFRAMPQRLERFATLVQRTVALKAKPNAQKKLAIYYYKGPGQSALTAGDLEVVPSLYALLRHLKAQGYTVDGLPTTEQDFAQLLQRRGPNIGPYAKGDFASFARDAGPAAVSAGELRSWCGKSLAQVLCEQVTRQFGPAPGSYLRLGDAVAVARVPLGNVVLLPQPLPGIGDETFKLVHGTRLAPPWPYVASYLWTRNVFGADAVMHFGTHGSLEFTPWKQVALSDRDWPDALIGEVPHAYLYTMGNVGEAIIAKRRSYATIVSHLTPPLREGGAQSAYKRLADLLQSWDSAASPALKAQYAQDVQHEAVALKLHQDLHLPEQPGWTEAQLQQLADHMETLENARITAGLYTLGTPYATADQRSTARLMGLGALVQALAELDVARGSVRRERLDRSAWLAARYRPRADALIAQLDRGTPAADVLAGVVAPDELRRAAEWERAQRKPSDDDLIHGFIGLADARASAPGPRGGRAAPDETALRQHLARALADPEKRTFLAELRSDQKFQHATRTLDPEALEKARTIARAVPAMARGLAIATDPDVRALLLAMQAPPVRAKVIGWLDEPELLQRAEAEAAKAREAMATAALAHVPALTLAETADAVQRVGALDAAQLRALHESLRFWRDAPPLPGELQARRTAAAPALSRLQAAVDREQAQRGGRERRFAQAVLTLRDRLAALPAYQAQLAQSPRVKLAALANALAGGFTQPSAGGDPIVNPAALPTGRNLFSIDAEKTPSEQAWAVGVRLADQLLAQHRAAHAGAWPTKVAFTLWAGDFIHTEGVAIAQILYLLGVEPVRDAFGRVASLRLIPRERLARPRVDVVVQTSGQLRDLAASRLYLINQAVALAAEAREEDNVVAQGTRATERRLKEQGAAPADAQRFAALRVFGGVNGNYGTGIMGLVEAGDRWQSEAEVARTYLGNMGAAFGEGDLWGAFQPGAFEAALANTDMVVQPLESNTWGPISLDHVYEFMGGLNLAVRQVTGKEPAAYFSDFRNPANPVVREAGAAMAVEAWATLLNPAYIEAMSKGGASSAEVFAETFRNVYGWNVTKPSVIAPALWDALHETYVRDAQGLGVHGFFERANPYALQEMTAVMLETARKGYWKPDAARLREVAQLHARLVRRFGASGTEFVNDNRALRAYIAQQLDAPDRQPYEDALQRSNEGGTIDSGRGVVLRKDAKPEAPAEAGAQAGDAGRSAGRNASSARWSGSTLPAAGVLAVLAVLVALGALLWWLRRRHADDGVGA